MLRLVIIRSYDYVTSQMKINLKPEKEKKVKIMSNIN